MGDGLKRSRRMDRSDGTARRLRSTFGVRLAGAGLCTAGLAFIGFGTLGAPATKGLSLTSAPTCASSTECIKPSQVPTSVANSTCSSQDIPGNSAPDNTDSWWHFVVPNSQNWSFTGSGFTATFTGGSVESVTYVQAMGGVFKGVVVEADGGATLTNAFVTDSGTNEPSEQEGTGPEGDDFVLSSSCGGDATTSTTATVSTTKTVTAPGTTVTTTVSGPTTTTTAPGTTTTTTAPGTTNTKTVTVSTATTVTVPTTVTDNTTQTNTATTTVSKTTTTTVTAPGTTVTVTTTVPTTNTVTTTVTSNHTATTTVTAPTTVTVKTTATNTTTATGTVTATTTKTVTTGTGAASTSSSSTSSSTPTSGVQAATTTPSTGSGSDIAFGTGLVLLVTGGGLIAGAARITRRKKS